MKIDLHKAYDYVDWSYIHLILHKIGQHAQNVEWIMACITTVSYDVLIKSTPTSFFWVGKGLRQGYSVSTLTFILVMDGLNMRIKDV